MKGPPRKKRRIGSGWVVGWEETPPESQPELHLPPELLEKIFSYFDTGYLLQVRKVSKSWNEEICRIIATGQRTKFVQCTENHGGFGAWEKHIRKYPGEDVADQVTKLTDILRTTTNPKLFSTYIITNFQSLLHSPCLLSPYGDFLTRLTVAVHGGMKGSSKQPTIALGILQEVLWNWCPNLRFLQLFTSRYDMTNIEEGFECSSTNDLGIQELDLRGRFIRNYPKFSFYLMKRCPDLRILRFPSHDGWASWQDDNEPTQFCKALAELPGMTRRLTELTISGLPWRRIPIAFADVQFVQLRKLELVDAQIHDHGTMRFAERLALHQVLDKVKFTLTDFVIHLNDLWKWKTMDPAVKYSKTLDISTTLPELKRLVILSERAYNISLYDVVRMTPKLEVLEVLGDFFFEDDLSKSLDWYFPSERTLASNPHTRLRKLVNYHPVGSIGELKGMLKSFPNVEHLGLCIQSYKVRPVMTGAVELHKAFGPLVAMPRLRTLDLWTDGNSRPKLDWTKALDQLDFFPCLRKLLIHTQNMRKSAVKKVKQCVYDLPSPPCPILFVEDEEEFEYMNK